MWTTVVNFDWQDLSSFKLDSLLALSRDVSVLLSNNQPVRLDKIRCVLDVMIHRLNGT